MSDKDIMDEYNVIFPFGNNEKITPEEGKNAMIAKQKEMNAKKKALQPHITNYTKSKKRTRGAMNENHDERLNLGNKKLTMMEPSSKRRKKKLIQPMFNWKTSGQNKSKVAEPPKPPKPTAPPKSLKPTAPSTPKPNTTTNSKQKTIKNATTNKKEEMKDSSDDGNDDEDDD